ncbi:MAG: hypothetical protein VX899_13705 [Myxococcota bacterium]|nr:hypothetical protein [Myxococcota bacterium]
MTGLFLLLSALTACDTTDDPVCDVESNGDTHCSGTLVVSCHAEEDMAGHFHSTDCGADGYTCVELDDSTATCADETATCTEGEATCSEDGGASGNCVDGLLQIALCESGSLCEVGDDGFASCERTSADECAGHGQMTDDGCACEDGYTQEDGHSDNCVMDPEAMCALFADTDHIHQTTAAEIAGSSSEGTGAFTSASHAPTMEVVEVQLTAGAPGYVHFPVVLDGSYAVMLDSADRFGGFQHRDGSVVESSALGPVSECSALLLEHHQGEGFENDGDEKVPYVLELQGGESDAAVRFLLAHVPDAHH